MALEIFKLMGSIFIDNDDANKKMEETDTKAKGIGERFSNGIKTVAKWGAGIGAAVGTAAIAMGVKGVKSADDLKQALDGFMASTGTATENLGEYEDVLKSIYANNFGDSFDDVAESMAVVKQNMQDLNAADLQSVTENALTLRDTFGFETEESIRAVKMMMDQFGVSADDAYNLIAQGAQNGLNKNGDLLDSINEYSVHFNQLGIDAEGMFNALANGTAEGTFSVDKLGDTVKEFGIRCKDGSDSTAEGFDLIGLSADDMATKFSQGGETAQQAFQDTIAALAKMEDPIAQNTAGVDLFGTMWEDLGAEGVLALANLNGEISNSTDAMAQINEIKYDSFGEAVEGIKRQCETNILVPLGQNILPILNNFANWFATDGVTYIQGFSEIVLPIFEGVFSFIQTGIDFIMPILSGLFDALLGGLTESEGTVSSVFESIKGMYYDIIQPLIDAITPAIQAILDNAQPIFEGIQEVFGVLVDYLQTAWDNIGKPVFDLIVDCIGIVSDVFAKYMPEISALFKDVCDTISQLWNDNLKPVFEVIGGFIKDTLAPLFKKVFEEYISKYVETAFNLIKNLWNNTLKPIFTGITEFISGIFTGNWKKAWEGVSKIFKGIFDGLVTIAKTPINIIIDVINGMIKGVCSGINTVIKAVNKLSFDVPDWIPGIGGKKFGFDLKEVTAPQIPKLENGGIVDEGQLFIAREKGAELIGSDGRGNTAVMNNDQIVESVSDGVAKAVSSVLGEQKLYTVIRKALDETTMKSIVGDYDIEKSMKRSTANRNKVVGELA